MSAVSSSEIKAGKYQDDGDDVIGLDNLTQDYDRHNGSENGDQIMAKSGHVRADDFNAPIPQEISDNGRKDGGIENEAHIDCRRGEGLSLQ